MEWWLGGHKGLASQELYPSLRGGGGRELRAREGVKESALICTSSGARSICLITAPNASAQHTMRAH
jgi:hypothetical protein